MAVLALFWLFVERQPLILGTSTNLGMSKESWEKATGMAQAVPELAAEVARTRRAAGEESLVTVDGCRYKIAAANRRGGRGLTINRLILDELREHDDWSAWNAAVPAMNAIADAQAIAITNQGDEKAVVLDSLRSSALRFIETGEGDARLGLFEYSAPDGSDPTDPEALAFANPNLGHRMELDSLMGDGRRAKEAGGAELAGFKVECLCMKVPMLDPAVDMDAWAQPFDPANPENGGCLDPGSLDDARSRLALVVDVAPDLQHATLYAAAMLEDGRVRVDPVAAWEGPSCTRQLRRELPGLVGKVRPQKFGWLPSGPAASIAADLAARKGWPPAGVTLEEIRSELPAVCMGFSEQVGSRQVAHSGDPLLAAHIEAAEKLHRGDGWVFTRKAGHVDALYAAAGATHLARTLPPSRRARLVVAGQRATD